MPVIYRCDHCRAEADARSEKATGFHEHRWNNEKYELCDSCHKTLNDYVIVFFQCGGK